MTSHIMTYETTADYTAAKASSSGINVPSISLCMDKPKVVYYDKKTVYPDLARSGDILIYNPSTYEKAIVPSETFRANYYQGFIPQGIVVIPPTHTSDGSIRVMSLVNMSKATPTIGSIATTASTADNVISWGGKSVNISELTHYDTWPYLTNGSGDTSNPNPPITVGYKRTRIPFDRGSGLQSGIDPYGKYIENFGTSYKYGIPPFTNEYEEKYPYYGSGCTSDMDGSTNTAVLVSYHTIDDLPNYTGGSITDTTASTSHAAAACCYLYETELFPRHSWYLPSIGEVGYITSRVIRIENSIGIINETMPNLRALIPIVDNSTTRLFSSTQHSVNEFYICTITGGTLWAQTKDALEATNHVRAMAKIQPW